LNGPFFWPAAIQVRPAANHLMLRVTHRVSSGGGSFKQDDTKLTGRCGESGNPITGEVNGQKVMFQTKSGEVTATCTADLDCQGTTMKGTWRLVDAEKKDGHRG
jgi:hypothetical protein